MSAVCLSREIMENRVDDDKALTIEATEVIREIAYAVNFVEISTVLPSGTNLVYINLTTKENRNVCIELTLQGFRIVGDQFNQVNQQHSSEYYETVYSLLDSLSPEYRSTFCETLSNKLMGLQRFPDAEISDDQMDTK